MTKNTKTNALSHKGYSGSIKVSIEDNCLHGKILFIDDIITYEGSTVEDIKTSFKEAVDRYLDYCEKTGKPANKAYSGTFNIRIGQDLHRKAAEIANLSNMTLNDFVAQSISKATEQNNILKVEHTVNHVITLEQETSAKTMVATMEQPNAWEKISAIN